MTAHPLVCPECRRHWTRPTLTKRQHELLAFIEAGIAANGYAPSFDEIAARLGVRGLATVHEHLTNLERKGYITRRHNEARSIALVA